MSGVTENVQPMANGVTQEAAVADHAPVLGAQGEDDDYTALIAPNLTASSTNRFNKKHLQLHPRLRHHRSPLLEIL